MSLTRRLGSWIRRSIDRGGPLSWLLGGVYSSYRRKVFEKYTSVATESLESRRSLVESLVSGKPDGNVVIIVIDCLRYRNTSIAGYTRNTTPYLSTFRVTLKSYSASSQTYSSVPSLLSGLYPHRHGAIIGGRVKFMRPEQFRPLHRNVVLLPEILYAFNYNVLFITSVTTAALPFIGRVPVVDVFPARAGKVLSTVRTWIKHTVGEGRRFFAYVHLGDTHEPLRPPRRFENYFGKVKKLKNIRTWNYTRPAEQKGPGFEEYRYNRMLLYDNTIRYVDYAIEKFINELKELGILDETLIIVTADHGEEFWEHALLESKYFYDPRDSYGTGHGHNFFNELIETPLLIQGPDIGSIARLVKGPISGVDIVPTVLEWLGLEHRIEFDGVSLIGGVAPSRSVLSEAAGYGYEKKALVLAEKKFLYSRDDGVAMIFDLAKDPLEQRPIFDEHEVKQMLFELRRLLVGQAARLSLSRRAKQGPP